MYALVQNGTVVSEGFPADFNIDGNAVSNPEMLPAETLAGVGYLPVTDDIPTYDTATQQAVFDHYEVLAASVVKHYVAESYTPTPTIEQLVANLQEAQNAIMMLSLE